ncbi:hypothetical protein BH10BAC5_BH10BAC5_27810 [soil metagenome]
MIFCPPRVHGDDKVIKNYEPLRATALRLYVNQFLTLRLGAFA